MTAKTASKTSPRANTLTDPAKSPLALPVASGAILEAAGQPGLFDDAAPDPRGATWRGFSLDHDESDAAAVFLRLYGQPPRYCFESKGLLLVGPVPGLEGTP